MRDTVSGAIAIPKASWGCAPALPNRIQVVFLGMAFRMFHVKHRIKLKSFLIQQFFKNAGEDQGEEP